MKYIKKKPHIIEAIQFDGSNYQELANFSNSRTTAVVHDDKSVEVWLKGSGLSIDKLIKKGDYLIKDSASMYGEFTVCGEKAFNEIYKQYDESLENTLDNIRDATKMLKDE